MNKAETIKYGLKLYQTRAALHKMGALQPVAEMINRGLWNDDKRNHNYLSGRMQNNDFLNAIIKLKTQLENEN